MTLGHNIFLKYFPGGKCLPETEMFNQESPPGPQKQPLRPMGIKKKGRTKQESKVWELMWLENIWHSDRKRLV